MKKLYRRSLFTYTKSSSSEKLLETFCSLHQFQNKVKTKTRNPNLLIEASDQTQVSKTYFVLPVWNGNIQLRFKLTRLTDTHQRVTYYQAKYLRTQLEQTTLLFSPFLCKTRHSYNLIHSGQPGNL